MQSSVAEKEATSEDVPSRKHALANTEGMNDAQDQHKKRILHLHEGNVITK